MRNSYSDFLTKAAEHFDQVSKRHPNSFTCKQGCHECCEPGLTVLKVEAENIASYIEQHPNIKDRLQKIQQNNPHNGTRCSMLDEDGHCVIYPVRPFICRSHGAPIAIAREEYYQIDVCPLNFTDNPIEELRPEEFFILDEWNDLLLGYADDEDRVSLLDLIEKHNS